MVGMLGAARRNFGAIAIAASTLGVAACVAIDPNATLCAVGGADCACTLGGACDPGLVCESGMCIDSAATTTNVGETTGDTDSSTSSPSTTMVTTASESATESSESGDVPSVANIAFVTSATYTAGSIGGLAGADAICQGHAEAAGIAGTYRAWISVAGEEARDRFGDASGWIRPDGRPVATDLQQMIEGRFFHPPTIDEHGVPFGVTTSAWTATNSDGTYASVDDFGACGGWTVDEAGGAALVGELGAGPGWWTAFATLPCASEAHLICLGTDQQFDLAFEPVDGRLAFVSYGLILSTAGRAEADALCQTEAQNAGVDGEFLSLLAVNGEAPADRFDAGGPPWVRHDGVPIFPEGEAFADVLVTPIVFDAEGGLSFLAIAWGGSYDAMSPGEDASSCTNWTVNTGLAAMFNTIHVFWQGWALGGGDDECAQAGYSVLCFEL